jgi:CRP/FNR family transcriptional regulator
VKTNAHERLAVLRRVALFADLSESELAFLADHATLKHFAPNESIFSEGDICLGLFIVQSGAVKIFKMAPSGREQVLGVEHGGNTIAELPVFDGGTYPASTLAIEESDLLFLKKEDFRSLCLEHPEVALKVLKVVGKRLRGLVGIIEELSFTTVRQRLIAYLLRIAGAAGTTKKSVELSLPVSHQELAAELGTVRELVSRNLSRLQAEGLIRIQARSVRIPDLAALRSACEPTD